MTVYQEESKSYYGKIHQKQIKFPAAGVYKKGFSGDSENLFGKWVMAKIGLANVWKHNIDALKKQSCTLIE